MLYGRMEMWHWHPQQGCPRTPQRWKLVYCAQHHVYIIMVYVWPPSKHEMLTQCWTDAGLIKVLNQYLPLNCSNCSSSLYFGPLIMGKAIPFWSFFYQIPDLRLPLSQNVLFTLYSSSICLLLKIILWGEFESIHQVNNIWTSQTDFPYFYI